MRCGGTSADQDGYVLNLLLITGLYGVGFLSCDVVANDVAIDVAEFQRYRSGPLSPNRAPTGITPHAHRLITEGNPDRFPGLTVRHLEPCRSGSLLGEADGESERKPQDHHPDASAQRVTDGSGRINTPYRQHDSHRENPGDDEGDCPYAAANSAGNRTR
jgi:hypothetical protein